MKITEFNAYKKAGQKITMVTCYDYASARILAESNVDCLLIGDSVAMVVHGHETTIPATIEMMVLHTKAVSLAASRKCIIADLPFLEYRQSLSKSVRAVQSLMQAGAHAVKLEGASGNLSLIRHLVASGVPVMGHIGLTPQSIHQLGGYRVQGKTADSQAALLEAAFELEAAGCFALVLECVPKGLAQEITKQLEIPTIGIGAGRDTDGQVLVWHDLLGLNDSFQAKFVKKYLNGFDIMKQSLNDYVVEVKNGAFPSDEYSY